MNKNNIILIGIVLLFLLVIRPMSSSKKTEDTAEGTSTGDTEKEVTLTTYPKNNYVATSEINNANTVPEVVGNMQTITA